MRASRSRAAAALLSLALAATALFVADAPSALAQQGGRRGGAAAPPAGVFKSRVIPHWFADNARFWYRNDLRGGAKEFVVVDVEPAKKAPAFDHQKLAAALSKTSSTDIHPERLPFDAVEFVDAGKAIRFTVGDKSWKCDLASYELSESPGEAVRDTQAAFIDSADAGITLALAGHDLTSHAASFAPDDAEPLFDSPQATQAATQDEATGRGRGGRGFGGGRGQGRGGAATQGAFGRGNRGTTATTADNRLTATVRDNNIFLRTADGAESQLTTDGSATFSYGRLAFSPDGSTLVAWRVEPGDRKEVYRLQSSPPGRDGATGGGTGRAILQTSIYALPGDKFDSYELNLFDVASKKQTKPQVDRLDFGAGGGEANPNIRWKSDGFRFTYEKKDRGHQRYRVMEVNTRTGEARAVLDEQSKTFIWTAHHNFASEGQTGRVINYLRNEDEILYASEKDGWRHLYLVDTKTANMKPITSGEWVVRGVQRIDNDNRQVWFSASGIYPGQDPYLVHYGRVNFDGSNLTWLTEANGNHSLTFTSPNNPAARSSFSPDNKHFIVTHSRVDLPPVTELRRAADGKRVLELEKADVETQWTPPEVFVAKGRDGKTDIWGLIYRPRNLDTTQKYAIIEDIYAGPQDSFVPKSFTPANRYQALNNLGFVVVKIDGMGTANRSKAFHDTCWQNLKDGGLPDRILWIKAAAQKYPYLDVEKVGIYGTSAGGQNAAAAVLFHPEFYKVAVANCGCHDNRMDKASWNEQWMGYPVGPHYAASSNIDNAHRLVGRLQLVLGELDSNVPVESTYRLVDALVKARKDFEFVLIPGADHGAGSPITQFKLQDFFVRYLQGKEPPHRNAPSGQTAP